MSSLKQIEANQRNAQRSPGPRTEEGKSTSRYNSLKSGIDAAAEAALPSESFHDLVLLTTEYVDRFNPRNPEERCLVDTLISNEWLLRRFRRIEGQLLTRSCQDIKQSEERFCLADAFDENARSLERLQRRVNATTKTFMKTLELLKRLQEDRKPLPLRRPQSQAVEPHDSEIGFVPQSRQSAPANAPRQPAMPRSSVSCPAVPPAATIT